MKWDRVGWVCICIKAWSRNWETPSGNNWSKLFASSGSLGGVRDVQGSIIQRRICSTWEGIFLELFCSGTGIVVSRS
jgi:hypothetical protein